jgi:hypothetical protein
VCHHCFHLSHRQHTSIDYIQATTLMSFPYTSQPRLYDLDLETISILPYHHSFRLSHHPHVGVNFVPTTCCHLFYPSHHLCSLSPTHPHLTSVIHMWIWKTSIHLLVTITFASVATHVTPLLLLEPPPTHCHLFLPNHRLHFTITPPKPLMLSPNLSSVPSLPSESQIVCQAGGGGWSPHVSCGGRAIDRISRRSSHHRSQRRY